MREPSLVKRINSLSFKSLSARSSHDCVSGTTIRCSFGNAMVNETLFPGHMERSLTAANREVRW